MPRQPTRSPTPSLAWRRTLTDQQPAPEHLLERLAVAVTLDAPPGQDQVLARRLEVEVHAVAVGAQAGLAHGLVAPALEVLGESQDDRAAGHHVLVPLTRERGHLAQLRRALAVVAADLRDQRAFAWVEPRKLGRHDQVARVLVVVVVGNRHPDVVEHRRRPQVLPLARHGLYPAAAA